MAKALSMLRLGMAAALLFVAAPARADDAWLAEANEGPLLTPPFRKILYAGELGRVKIVKGQALRLSLGPGSKGGLVAVVPQTGKARTGEKELLSKSPLVFTDTVEETDALAFKVITGVAQLEADLEPMEERTLSSGESLTLSMPAFQEWTVRFVNVSDFRSAAVYSFFAGGEDISKASEYDRTIALEYKGSSRVKTWKSAADKLVIDVRKGTVLVKAGKPFTSPSGK